MATSAIESALAGLQSQQQAEGGRFSEAARQAQQAADAAQQAQEALANEQPALASRVEDVASGQQELADARTRIVGEPEHVARQRGRLNSSRSPMLPTSSLTSSVSCPTRWEPSRSV